MNVIDKAELYSQEANDLANKEMIKRAFYDGYCEAKFHNEALGLEFVDLGLPSGKLWSNNYLQAEGKTIRFESLCSTRMPIPTINDVQELVRSCKWTYDQRYIYCTGPNKKILRWKKSGLKMFRPGDATPYFSIVFAELWVRQSDSMSRCEIQICDLRAGRAKIHIIPGNYMQSHPMRLVK